MLFIDRTCREVSARVSFYKFMFFLIPQNAWESIRLAPTLNSQHANEMIQWKNLFLFYCPIILKLMTFILAARGHVDLFALTVLSWQAYHLQRLFLNMCKCSLHCSIQICTTRVFIHFNRTPLLHLWNDKQRLLPSSTYGILPAADRWGCPMSSIWAVTTMLGYVV